ncbi:natural killer cells antigen CD94-like [Cheilinus undulatus]|uniref:natural killer cells antigen CD94-like n=1 Tax=Cheilinus undulatus TaxID=241271 RepID=UPI001BD3A4ED|nr:natural killer cells antigen CD94-like [Cheilinus undulatus]
MEEQLNYAEVTFSSKNGVSAFEKPDEMEIIYDEVKTEEQTGPTTPPTIPVETEQKARLCTPVHVVAAGLGIICVILALFIIILKIQLNTAMSEHLRDKNNLTAQNQQLWSEKADLQRKTQELTREKEGLSWTLGVILEHNNFPVDQHCPQKECKPCLDNWVQFQSNCYLFMNGPYSQWRYWKDSRGECGKFNAELVVIDSQEEQEFINYHTEIYDDEKHGYWIGLSKESWTETWMWVDGSNFTVAYWRDQPASSRLNCALISPHGEPLANWQKTSCTMYNRYICESRALIKPESAA